MAAGEIRIGIPGNSTTNFNAASLAVLTLYRGGEGVSFSQRAAIGYDTTGTPTNWGTTPIIGPAYAPKFLWTLTPWLTTSEAQHLEALAIYQKSTQNALRLIDEVDQVVIDPAYNNRTLLSQTTPSWGAAYRVGYGVFSVQLQLEDAWSEYIGQWAEDDAGAKAATITAVEL
jgi:hypothetical protein